MTSDARDRAIDRWLAFSLAALPLLPAGPTYVGLDRPWALEAFFLLTLGIGVVLLTRARDRARAHLPIAARRVRRGYLLWLVPASAAAVIGVLDRMPFDAVLLRVETDGLVRRLARPMDQAGDALYPIRVWLTCLEGAVMFWLVSALLSRTSRPRRRVRAALRGCVIGVALVSLIAVAQYLTRFNLHEYWVRANPGLTRAHATLDDPNSLASFLVLGVGLSIGAAWSGLVGRRRQARFALGTAVLSGVALITTVSRAGWASMAIAALLTASMLPDRLTVRWPVGGRVRQRARAITGVLLALSVVWAVAFVTLPKHDVARVPTTPWEALVQTVDPRESLETLLKRRHLPWSAGVQMAATHPLAGAGLGQFPRRLAASPGSDGPENAHNYFLQVLAETGVIGLVGLTALLTLAALAVRDAIRHAAIRGVRYGVGVALGLLAFVLTWLTGHPLLNLSHQLWLASVLAVGLAAAAPAARSRVSLDARILQPRWVGAMLALTLAAAVPRAADAIRSHDAFGSYAVGVYGWETAPSDDAAPPGARFRWTRARAAFREPMREPLLTIPLYLARPDLPGRQVRIEVTLQGVQVPPAVLDRNGWHMLTYDLRTLLGAAESQTQPSLTVLLAVHPAVVPAAVSDSVDTRELGVGVGEFQWSSAAGSR